MTSRKWLGLPLLLFSIVISGDVQATDSDVLRGERIFRLQCSGCHSIQPEQHVAGPSLHGVLGRRVGKLPGFDFSPILQEADFVWTPENLDRFLSDPSAMLPGTRMVFWGLAPQPREQVIGYLQKIAEED